MTVWHLLFVMWSIISLQSMEVLIKGDQRQFTFILWQKLWCSALISYSFWSFSRLMSQLLTTKQFIQQAFDILNEYWNSRNDTQKPWTSQECYIWCYFTEAMNIPGMLYRMLFYRNHEHPRNVRGFCFTEAMDIPGMLEDFVSQKPWTFQECYTGFCSIEAMDIPGMLENIVLQKPWTSQECYTGFCSIEAMDMPGMLQRILFYRIHGHLRNVTYDLLYISIDV